MKLKIGLLQMNGKQDSKEAYINKASEFCKKARTMGADIALFPEMWNIGYKTYHKETEDYDYNPLEPRHPELIEAWQKQSDRIDSDYIKHFMNLAKELELAIGVTYLRTNPKGKPFNSMSLINRFGTILYTYDKVHTCDFSLEYHMSHGDAFKVATLDTKEGPVEIGTMICYDREFPESARILMLKGAEIILVPNACEMEQNRLAQLRTRAYENMVGIAMTNYGGEGFGHSIAFDGRAFDENGSRDMTIIEANTENHIFIAEFDMNQLRKYRQGEAWGNAFRKPQLYKEIIQEDIKEPFIRDCSRRI